MSRRFFPNHPLVRQGFKVLAWVPVGIFFSRNVYSLASVGGDSMQPTFNPDLYTSPLHKDVVLLNCWRVRLGEKRYRRGDVVTLCMTPLAFDERTGVSIYRTLYEKASPENPELLVTKRIVALEGDIVTPLPPSTPRPIKIPPGHCWVEGDTANKTRDSNLYGPIPLGLINAQVEYVLWPPKRQGLVLNGWGKSEGRVKRIGKEYAP